MSAGSRGVFVVDLEQCHKCASLLAPFRRGLCDRCYDRARRDGTLEVDGLPPRRNQYQRDPHLHNCPECAGGGLVATYQADHTGRALSYICLAPAHGAGHRFPR